MVAARTSQYRKRLILTSSCLSTGVLFLPQLIFSAFHFKEIINLLLPLCINIAAIHGYSAAHCPPAAGNKYLITTVGHDAGRPSGSFAERDVFCRRLQVSPPLVSRPSCL